MAGIFCGDALHALSFFEDNSIPLVYIDPPFNTGNTYQAFTQGRRLEESAKFTPSQGEYGAW